MKYYYGARKKYGVYRGVVFHFSNLDEDEVFIYWSKESFDTSSDAIDNALAWAREEGYKVEIEP